MDLTLKLVYIFAIIGVLDTLYLIYHKIRGTEVACVFFPKEWCYKVQHSPQSKTFGIPNSVAGFVMYVLILVLAYLFAMGTLPFWPLQTIITFGFLFSLYFMFVQGFILRAFCTWCVISFINFTVMGYAVFLM
ncbi:MAG: vitamin K epoxide reductase family protein [Patescibacteria group bacterium]